MNSETVRAKTQVWYASGYGCSQDVFKRADVKKDLDKRMAIGEYQKIGYRAFYNVTKIRKVAMSRTVEYIENEAFRGCTMLRTIEMTSNVKKIGEGAFYGCLRLKEIEVPKSIDRIEEKTFKQCRALERLNLNAAINYIGANAFLDCETLKEILIPERIAVIHFRTFYGCKNLTKVELPDGLKTISREAFSKCGFKSITLNKGLEYIGEAAFSKCRELEYIEIPESVITIDKWAFHGCNDLKKVVFKGEPQKLGDWIFNKNNVTVVCRKDSMVEDYCALFGYQTEDLENYEVEE